VELEIYHNSTNQQLFYEFSQRYGVKDPKIPAVFLADVAMIAEDEIEELLEPTIQRIIDSDYTIAPPEPVPGGDNTTGSVGPGPSKDLTIAMVIGASLADSINPCAISVMVFLLMFMSNLGDRKKVLYVGVAYIVAVFLGYFIAGLGLLTFLHSTSMTRAVYYIAASLSIALGLINIKDFFLMGRKSDEKATLAIPESRKPLIKKYIEKASIPAAIVLGIVVSLFELPCTGGVYLAILSLLSNSMTMWEGIPYLALYNAIFVLPLGIILGVFYRGTTADKLNTWRLEKRRWLRLLLGVVMMAIGGIMLYEVM
jgi:cytochrome c biogenesis protein CcdA